jgi:hypothetical protein
MKRTLESMFIRLYETVTMPFGLPVFKAFPAPVDAVKFSAFFGTLQANGWDVDASLEPYKDDEQMGVVAFFDGVTGDYKFCPTALFFRLNGYHISIAIAEE